MTGTFCLRRLAGRFAYVAEVEVDVKAHPGGEGTHEVRFAPDCFVSIGDDALVRCACMFGAMYALESLFVKGAYVIVFKKVKGYPVDTTSLCLAFAACHAVWNALQTHPSIVPKINEEGGTFEFPR